MKLGEISSVFDLAERKMPFADVDRFVYLPGSRREGDDKVGAIAGSDRFAV